VIDERSGLVLAKTESPKPALVVNAEEIVPLAERARGPFLGANAQYLSSI